MYKIVLVPLDGSKCAESILPHVEAMAKAFESQLILLRVVDHAPDSVTTTAAQIKKEDFDSEQENAEAYLDEQAEQLRNKGLEARTLILYGAAVKSIIEAAKEEKVDLIVTGRKKRTLLEKVYVGSHILDLLRRSSVPILMAKYMVAYEIDGDEFSRVNDHIFEKPLLATDWSEPSQRARDALVALKGVAKEVLVAHVIGSKLAKGRGQEGLTVLREKSEKRLDSYCQEIEKLGLSATAHLALGRVVPEIIKTAREHKATMVVMGRTGKDWFEEYWLGGVTHRVAELSEVPVLIIP